MRPALCLRCDWEGETDAAVCPNCGTGLFRPTAPPPAILPAPQTQTPTPASPGEPPGPRYLPGDEGLSGTLGRRRSRSFVLSVALAATLTGVLWWFLRAHEVAAPNVPGPRSATAGTVVFVGVGQGSQQLWSLDLGNGDLLAGTPIRRPVVELVAVRGLPDPLGAATRSIGITTSVAGGGAQLAWSPSVAAAPIPLAGGDLAAWQADGAAAVVVRTGPTSRPCGGSLRMDRVDTATGAIDLVFASRHFCGEVRNVQEGVAATYFTWVRPGGTGVYYVGNGVPHLVLSGYEMLSMSATADMLVRPIDGAGTALFWRNADAPRPYVLDGAPLQVDQLLAWNSTRQGALVIGSAGGRQGLFSIDTTPAGSKTPRYLGPVAPPVSAAAAGDGSFYLATGGRLVHVRTDGLEDVAFPVGSVPEGAPVPGGPLVWVPG